MSSVDEAAPLSEEDDRFTADDMPPGMASFTFVLLRRPENAPDLPDEELDRLQAGHLAHLDRYRADGSIAAAGPFSDQSDPRLRGIELWTLPVDEVRTRCQEDPSVQAGRLEKLVMRWWFREADLPITPNPVGTPRPDAGS
jgi:hypothetical protein